tara:strand:- start:377 stop:526 length:150 start_codon:yes stop_codon:yes gene_type:complete
MGKLDSYHIRAEIKRETKMIESLKKAGKIDLAAVYASELKKKIKKITNE